MQRMSTKLLIVIGIYLYIVNDYFVKFKYKIPTMLRGPYARKSAVKVFFLKIYLKLFVRSNDNDNFFKG